jgi:hypothetical protein
MQRDPEPRLPPPNLAGFGIYIPLVIHKLGTDAFHHLIKNSRLHSIYHHQISSNAMSSSSGIKIGKTGYIEESPSTPASIPQLYSARSTSRETTVCLTGMLLQWPSHDGKDAPLRTALVIRPLSLAPADLIAANLARYNSVTELAEAQSARFAAFVDGTAERITLHRAAELLKGNENFVARRDHSQGAPDWIDKAVSRIVSVVGATVLYLMKEESDSQAGTVPHVSVITPDRWRELTQTNGRPLVPKPWRAFPKLHSTIATDQPQTLKALETAKANKPLTDLTELEMYWEQRDGRLRRMLATRPGTVHLAEPFRPSNTGEDGPSQTDIEPQGAADGSEVEHEGAEEYQPLTWDDLVNNNY